MYFQLLDILEVLKPFLDWGRGGSSCVSEAVETASHILFHCPLFVKAKHNKVETFIKSDIQCSGNSIIFETVVF